MYFWDNFKELLFFYPMPSETAEFKVGGRLARKKILDDLGRTLVADYFVIKTIVYCRLLKFLLE